MSLFYPISIFAVKKLKIGIENRVIELLPVKKWIAMLIIIGKRTLFNTIDFLLILIQFLFFKSKRLLSHLKVPQSQIEVARIVKVISSSFQRTEIPLSPTIPTIIIKYENQKIQVNAYVLIFVMDSINLSI